MFEKFTESARQVVVHAQDEARHLRHNYIGTEHLLLGLLRDEESPASRALDSFDVTIEEVRAIVQRIVGEGSEVTSGQIPFTPRAKKVLELALRESRALDANYIGPEHILLGLMCEKNGVAARILFDFDLDIQTLRNAIVRAPLARSRRPAPRWEYHVLDPEDVTDERLNALASEGWDIATALGERLILMRRA